MNCSSYQDLNLREGASVSEIKAAFRHMAKTCHPDAAGNEQDNVEKFIKVQTAYQKLMKKAIARNQARQRKAAETFPPVSSGPSEGDDNSRQLAGNWRFESSREIGLDVYYCISLKLPAKGSGCRVLIPWQSREACPRCFGQGHALEKISSNELYRPNVCTKCGGAGSLSGESKLEVIITPEMAGRNKIRLRKAGLYNLKQAQRGDLILEVNWVRDFQERNY